MLRSEIRLCRVKFALQVKFACGELNHYGGIAVKIIYPAVFHEEDGSYWVEFPDLDGCFSDGDSIVEALENAKEALALYCTATLEDRKMLPAATPVRDIDMPEDGFVSIVEAELVSKSRAVKKTLTIPSWLNEIAEEKGVNFSAALQNALMKELNIAGLS